MKLHQLNESFTVLEPESEQDKITINKIFDFLKVERPGAYFEPAVKAGYKSPYDFFSSIQHDKLLLMNGHVDLLKNFGIFPVKAKSEYTEKEIDDFIKEIKPSLPFEPYDFQLKAFKESLLYNKQINKMCTSSGKSLTISLIVEFFRKRNKKGLLLVPNINLLTQFKGDIKEYNLNELYDDTHIIGGGSIERHFNNSLTISTWQSLLNYHGNLDKLEYVICDECLHPETLIETNNGKIPIQKIRIKDEVLTLNEKTNKKEFKPVVKVHKNISKKEKMLKITLENDKTIKITGNHKVLTERGWVRADELNLSDDIIHI